MPGSCACKGFVASGVVDDNGGNVANDLVFLLTDLCG